MTPADEARFIALWQAGTETAAIAAQLGIPPGTVSSRAKRLVEQGKLQPRPRGGAYPGQRAKARPEGTSAPVQRPVQTIDTGAVQSVDTGAVQRLDRLEDEVHGLRQIVQSLADRLDRPPVQTPVQITALPPYPKGKAVRWNLWILDVIKEQISTLAAERDLSPSELVQELLWQALTDQSLSTR
jgi:Winged helix-turn-helix DNA-binding